MKTKLNKITVDAILERFVAYITRRCDDGIITIADASGGLAGILNSLVSEDECSLCGGSGIDVTKGQVGYCICYTPKETNDKRLFWEWVNSVPYDNSELMELIALDILKDYGNWLDQKKEYGAYVKNLSDKIGIPLSFDEWTDYKDQRKITNA